MKFKFPYSAVLETENNIAVPVVYKFFKVFIHDLLLSESVAVDLFDATVYLS